MGEKYEHFQVLRRPDGTLWELGRGTLGVTYKALDTGLRAEVALKVIRPTALGDASSRHDFIEAARASAALRHPNVATLFHLGEAGGECYFAMEFVAGQTLDVQLRERGPLALREGLEVGIQVASALAVAEPLGLLHGDIKPSNLMLVSDDDGRTIVKLMDFGLAIAVSGGSRAGGFRGTADFASPEQASGQGSTSDLYALGVTLSLALTGKLPSLAAKSLPQDVQAVLDDLLNPDPSRRLASASTLRQRLEACLAACAATKSSPLPVKAIAVSPPKIPPQRRAPVLAMVLGFVVLLGMIGVSAIIASLLPGFQALAPTPSATPQPTATPIAQTSPLPTPEPTLSPLDKLMADAAALQTQEKYGAALQAYAAIATQFPREKKASERMEMIAALLRSNGFSMNAQKFTSLRKPLTIAAGLDVISAQILLGEQLRRAEPAESLKWFSAAAENGQTEAMTQAGLMLANRRGTSAPNLALAVRWFEKASAAGDTEAMAALAECMIYGKGTEKNTQRAIELLGAASAFKNPRAINLLGDLAFRGDGMPQNYPEALRLFTEAADLGDGEAMANLGVLHMRGAGIPANPTKAVSIWKLGSQKNHPACMVNYAKALTGGVGTKANPDEARRWFIEAAILGNIAAMDWCDKNKIPY